MKHFLCFPPIVVSWKKCFINFSKRSFGDENFLEDWKKGQQTESIAFPMQSNIIRKLNTMQRFPIFTMSFVSIH